MFNKMKLKFCPLFVLFFVVLAKTSANPSIFSWITSLFFAEEKLDVDQFISIWCLNKNELSLFDNNKINVSKSLAVYIHGYNEFKLRESWAYQVMLEHVKFVDANVCALNWWNITAKMPHVTAEYVPKVGAHLGKILTILNQRGMDYRNMALIGHSFGAHVAGVAGLKTGGKIGAIYALDPAGPFFYDKSKDFTISNDKRLDKTDARFVQALHTNTQFFGTIQPIGHQDFYLNGGDGMPNCTKSYSVVNNMCDHNWAKYEFIRTLDPRNKLLGTLCDTYATFSTKTCSSSTTDTFGIYSKKTVEGKFYLTV